MNLSEEINGFEGDILLLNAELDMMVNSYWNSKARADVEMQEVSPIFTTSQG
jgi:hypothetical protein